MQKHDSLRKVDEALEVEEVRKVKGGKASHASQALNDLR